jgi:hypothetical protein
MMMQMKIETGKRKFNLMWDPNHSRALIVLIFSVEKEVTSSLVSDDENKKTFRILVGGGNKHCWKTATLYQGKQG